MVSINHALAPQNAEQNSEQHSGKLLTRLSTSDDETTSDQESTQANDFSITESEVNTLGEFTKLFLRQNSEVSSDGTISEESTQITETELRDLKKSGASQDLLSQLADEISNSQSKSPPTNNAIVASMESSQQILTAPEGPTSQPNQAQTNEEVNDATVRKDRSKSPVAKSVESNKPPHASVTSKIGLYQLCFRPD